ncbi:MAG: hypothetical protein WC460_06775 [Patescibacteria group bacterium]
MTKIYRVKLGELKKLVKEQSTGEEDYKRRYAEVAKKGKHVVDKLNAEMMTSVVKIRQYKSSNKLSDEFTPSYEIIFDFKDDAYVNNEKYLNGNAYIYLSDELYSKLEQMADNLGLSVLFNNTKSIFWFSMAKEE